MLVERLILGDLETNCWVVADDAGGPAVVIDPAGGPADAPRIVAAAGGRTIELVLLTHAHFDHLGAAGALIGMTRAHLAVHAADAPRITSPAAEGTGGALFGYEDVAPPADRLLADGDRIVVGALKLDVWLTPGHTAGSISLLADAPADEPEVEGKGCAEGPLHLFSGDTLFAGSVGRTDFPAGDSGALRRSIARIATLPGDTLVHPGHGPDTTIDRERRLNPFFPRA